MNNNPPLYDWQLEALNKLRLNNYSGIICAVTGTGKTRVGLEVVKEINTTTLIVVPTIQLMNQWLEDIRGLGYKDEHIGLYYGEMKEFNRVTIAVIDSVYKLIDLDKRFELLVLDEVHRYGSNYHQKLLLNNDFKYRVGLTATLERKDGNHELLIQRIGRVVIEYTVAKAVDDDLLNDYYIYNVGLELPLKEKDYLNNLDTSIKGLMSSFNNDFSKVIESLKRYGNGSARKILSLVNKRKQFYNNSTPKIAKASYLIKDLNKGLIYNYIYNNKEDKEFNEYLLSLKNKDNEYELTDITINKLINNIYYNKSLYKNILNNKALRESLLFGENKIIVFGSYIESADKLHTELEKQDIKSYVYYSGNKKSKFNFNNQDKQEVIKSFRKEYKGVLLTVKSLDEGLNVKDCNIAIVLGYDKVKRQAVQRMGRILRKEEGKTPVMFLFYYRDTNDFYNAKNFADEFKDAGNIVWS